MKRIVSLVLVAALLLVSVFALASCGPKYEPKFGKKFAPQDSQMNVLLALNAKTIDVGVMDSIMAGYYMSKDTKYANSLMIVEDLVLAEEQYGIASRKGSGLTKKINEALVALTVSGDVGTIAAKYGLENEICIDTTVTVDPLTDAEKADWEYIVGKGKFTVGYTLFAPIAYEDDNGDLIGFDIELAKAVAEYLELDVEFQVIDWDAKEALLKAMSIDCIWNGMTITEERIEKMEVSIPYMNNKQVAVIRKADAELYKTTADMAEATVGAESGSAGMSCAVVEE